MSRRIFIVCVVDCSDLFHDALQRFQATRFPKQAEAILFIYNIGEEEIQSVDVPRPESKVIVFNNTDDLMTLKPYGKDYLTATADATVIAQQLAGTAVSTADFKYYNFFNKPKVNTQLTALAKYQDDLTNNG
jgi:hypothetical protein